MGMDYMLARYYAHTLARLLSPDAFGGQASSPQSWNLYAYVGNNPLRYYDPLGLYKVEGDEAAVAEFNEQTSEAIGLPVSEDEEGNMTRAAGPPAPENQAAVEAFDAAAGADFTINAVTESEFVVDNFETQEVNSSHISELPTTAPAGSPQAVTQGEVVTHILTEYTTAANGLGFQGKAAYDAAHSAGLNAQNEYRADHGQAPVVREKTGYVSNWPVGAIFGSRTFYTAVIATGNSTTMTRQGAGWFRQASFSVSHR
jgi:hypothetical protein